MLWAAAVAGLSLAAGGPVAAMSGPGPARPPQTGAAPDALEAAVACLRAHVFDNDLGDREVWARGEAGGEGLDG